MGFWKKKGGHGYSFLLLLNHDMIAIKRQEATPEIMAFIEIRNVPFRLYLFKPH